ncbi:MAG: hypothetical protein H6581_26060 [Bacteroidia bacterium]|nr:hypothetical protein [Bacteroidia bacterium]
MADLFQNKYRIASARLAGWDYGTPGAYFVTICTREREHYFGQVKDGVMDLSKAGQIAWDVWQLVAEQFDFAALDAFVVMPNHVHGIVWIRDEPVVSPIMGVEPPVETRLIASLRDNRDDGDDGENRNADNHHNANNNAIHPPQPSAQPNPQNPLRIIPSPMQVNNLSRIIRWYKGRTTYECRRAGLAFAWQARFHDHIVREGDALVRIRQYIVQNPANWGQDRFFRR